MPKIAVLARIVLAAAAPLAAMSASAEPAATPSSTRVVSDASFCIRAQRLLTDVTMVPNVVRHETWTSYKESKSSIRPFEIHLFVTADAETRNLPVLVSCKLKSADHVAAVYGASAAGPVTRSCTVIDQDTVERVFASLTTEERARAKLAPRDIVFDAEKNTYTGPSWLAPYPYAFTSGGKLHLATKALVVNWNDWMWKWLPDKARGVHYCHNVAPEYLRRIVLGEAVPPPGGA